MQKVYDVIVAGAGPGGSAAAHFLSRAGLEVLLLDKHEFPRDKTCGDGLSPRALGVLDDMGVLGEIRKASHQVNGLVIRSPTGRPIEAPLPSQGELPPYGLVTPRFLLDNVLRQRALASGAGFASQVRVNGVVQEKDCAVVKGKIGSQTVSFRARMVMIATGANFNLLQQLGLVTGQPQHMVAARAYFEDLQELPDRFHFYFEGVPLPGYGWVFPLSATSANIGAGFLRGKMGARQLPSSARQAFDDFLRQPRLKRLLDGARLAGPVKGYPLLVGYRETRVFRERLLVIGEAAGLVNPLTGEGVDNALESGRLAAAHLLSLFAEGDLSIGRLARYETLLRNHFQKHLDFCAQLRDLFLARRRLDVLIGIGNRRPNFKMDLIRIALGLQTATGGASFISLFKSLFARQNPLSKTS